MPPLVTAALKMPVRRLGRPRWPVSPLTLYWAVFAVSIGSFLLDYAVAGRWPALSAVLQVVALVPCGFAWLLTRALFKERTAGEWWPELIVAALLGSCLVMHLDHSGAEHGLVGYIGQIQGLLGTAILLLTFLEVLNSKSQSGEERRFRWLFGTTYLALIGVSLGFALPEFEAYGDTARAVLASIALLGGTAAWRYRCGHPLSAHRARDVARPALAARIERALHEHKVYLEPSLKVADLAMLVGAPDYQVSQAIVRDLGYPNFNQLVNRYRLDTAKARLVAPEHADESILAVAMDSGFASLGPFNRAFKQDTGVTPSQFRRAAIG